uniref:2OG-FeII_Oxy_2 domain-containing protein n=1 Tax=Steinernema glaseri TaxID=37863 RepID=A0A1I7YRV5_9BILA
MRLTMIRRLPSLIRFHKEDCWPQTILKGITQSCTVQDNFINEQEEAAFMKEIEPHMKRLRYEKTHWDDAIHLYREREQRRWSEENDAVLSRMRTVSFPKDAHHLTYVHILDLHKDGKIKPHIDSVRYCGDVITGISLLSDAVMRLRHKDRPDEWIVDLLLKRRSLYKLSGIGRYDFLHEVLGEEDSFFNDMKIARDRRISIICRDLPKAKKLEDDASEALKLKPLEGVA